MARACSRVIKVILLNGDMGYRNVFWLNPLVWMIGPFLRSGAWDVSRDCPWPRWDMRTCNCSTAVRDTKLFYPLLVDWVTRLAFDSTLKIASLYQTYLLIAAQEGAIHRPVLSEHSVERKAPGQLRTKEGPGAGRG